MLHFPPDDSIGWVGIEGETPSDWQLWADAQGDVSIPAGRKIELSLSVVAKDNPPALAQLADMPIDILCIYDDYGREKLLEKLKAMPAVKELNLHVGNWYLPPADLQKFPKVERLEIESAEIDGAGFQIISGIKTLRQLTCETADLAAVKKVRRIKDLRLSVLAEKSVPFEEITCLNNLTELTVTGREGVSLEAPRQAAACKSLRHLNLQSSATPAVIAAFSASKKLESLALWRTDITDAHLVEVSKISGLKRLELESGYGKANMISDAGLSLLGNLTNLEELVLCTERLAVPGAKRLAALPRLRELKLRFEVPRDVLEALAESKSLSKLSIGGCPAPEDLLVLKKLRTLKSLNFEGKFDQRPYEKIVEEELQKTFPELRPGPLPAAGEAIWQAFQDALRSGDWDKALSFCSEYVKKRAGEFANLESFFKETVPIAMVVQLQEMPSQSNTYYARLVSKGKYVPYHFMLNFSGTAPEIRVGWEWDIGHADDTWSIRFDPLPLQALLDKARREERKEQEATRLFQGVSIKLTASKETYALGEPVLLRLDLINDGAFWVYCDSQGTGHGALDVRAENGEKVRYIRPPVQTGGCGMPLGPGKSDCIYKDRDVSKWYDLSQSGKYTIEPSTCGLGVWLDPTGAPARFEVDSKGKITSVTDPYKKVYAPNTLKSNAVTFEIH